ncbi:MAG: RsmG family class I SAM-dependent methyltransferase, partial [Bacteroidota bacterium]
LAIARPDITVTVIDSIQKKTRTVQNILMQLALPNVEVVTGRAEELKPKKGSGYHVVVARAVAPLVDLLKWSANLFERRDRKVVRAILPGSIQEVQTPLLAAMKGGELDDEIRRAAVHFPGLVSYVARFPCTTEDVPLLDDKRVIIVPR